MKEQYSEPTEMPRHFGEFVSQRFGDLALREYCESPRGDKEQYIDALRITSAVPGVVVVPAVLSGYELDTINALYKRWSQQRQA